MSGSESLGVSAFQREGAHYLTIRRRAHLALLPSFLASFLSFLPFLLGLPFLRLGCLPPYAAVLGGIFWGKKKKNI